MKRTLSTRFSVLVQNPSTFELCAFSQSDDRDQALSQAAELRENFGTTTVVRDQLANVIYLLRQVATSAPIQEGVNA